jgi:hypothetical protein
MRGRSSLLNQITVDDEVLAGDRRAQLRAPRSQARLTHNMFWIRQTIELAQAAAIITASAIGRRVCSRCASVLLVARINR